MEDTLNMDPDMIKEAAAAPIEGAPAAKVTRKRAPKRPERKPVGLRRGDQTKQREGYYRRWVNDKGKRVEAFEEGWYEKVLNEKGEPVKRLGGGNLDQYLMEIPIELYNEDQAKKQANSAATINDMLQAKPGQYVPNKPK